MNQPARLWNTAELISNGCEALTSGGRKGAAWIDGRILSVKTSIENNPAGGMSLGYSALPAGYATPPHSHDAEELAFILVGEGAIVVDGVKFRVGPGDILLTPSGSEHATVAGPDGALVIWWVYAPPGSEARWTSEGALDDGSGIGSAWARVMRDSEGGIG